MQVTKVVNSYAVPKLTMQYHEGTREWMFNDVKTWLDAATLEARGQGSGSVSRLFLVLASAGMGKSVFSAVMAQKLEVDIECGLVHRSFINAFTAA